MLAEEACVSRKHSLYMRRSGIQSLQFAHPRKNEKKKQTVNKAVLVLAQVPGDCDEAVGFSVIHSLLFYELRSSG